jgi:transcriptional regulator with XRE-family HTH domain
VEAGLSQEEAARRAGITRVHWQRLESELPNPTVETLFRVAKVFGVPPGELLSAKR